MTSPDDAEVVELAEAVAAGVLALPGVSDLHGGMFGEVATYLPGRRLQGVRVDAEHVDVHVVMWWGHDVRALAKSVQDVVTDLALGRSVSVTVEDIAVAPADSSATERNDASR